jgi:peptidyl-prolyl cis-trans isomerase SurA
VKFSASILLATLFVFIGIADSHAQESEVKVVDEVVAVVNEGVITLSRVKREMELAINSLVEDGKTREEAARFVEENQGEIIASIINEELLMQKGKEIGVDSDVESQVNQRFVQLMKQQNLKTIDTLFREMEKQGISPDAIRDNWRKQITQDLVLQREVDGRTYWGWSARELRAYYEKNKDKFTKPERVALQEIFLAFAGRAENVVRERATQIVARVRAGEDFGNVAMEVSDRPDVRQTKGEVGKFSYAELGEISPLFVEPLKATKTGDVTDPIETVEGIEIFKVVSREEATKESVFDETEVRRAMTYEVLNVKRREYMVTLREDAYIKINDSYRPIVAPVLFAEERRSSN